MSDTPRPGWVLVVDDDVGLARVVMRVLSQWVPCRTASSPADALALYAAHPGLVGALVDLYLGDAHGVRHVAEPLRALEPGLDVRIFTGSGPEDPNVRRIKDAGFWYVLKDEANAQLRALGPQWGRMAALVSASVEPPTAGGRRMSGTPSATEPDERIVERRLGELRTAGTLSARQLEILAHQVRGLSHTEVARVVGISTKAIEHHSREARKGTGKSLFEHAHDVVAGTSRTLRRLRD